MYSKGYSSCLVCVSVCVSACLSVTLILANRNLKGILYKNTPFRNYGVILRIHWNWSSIDDKAF